MFPARQRGQRWRRMSPTVPSFVAGRVIVHHSVFIFFRSVVRDLQQTEGQLVPRVKADLRCLSADPSGRPTGTTERRALPEPA
jgi:hypothetical protein